MLENWTCKLWPSDASNTRAEWRVPRLEQDNRKAIVHQSTVCRMLNSMWYWNIRPVRTVNKKKRLPSLRNTRIGNHVVKWITLPVAQCRCKNEKAYTPHAWVQPFTLMGACFPGTFWVFNPYYYRCRSSWRYMLMEYPNGAGYCHKDNRSGFRNMREALSCPIEFSICATKLKALCGTWTHQIYYNWTMLFMDFSHHLSTSRGVCAKNHCITEGKRWPNEVLVEW